MTISLYVFDLWSTPCISDWVLCPPVFSPTSVMFNVTSIQYISTKTASPLYYFRILVQLDVLLAPQDLTRLTDCTLKLSIQMMWYDIIVC